MAELNHDFNLVDEEANTGAEGPTTERLDSGDFYNAPERHWLVRFSVVVFCVGLLAGTSGTTAVSNPWVGNNVSVICMTLTASCVIAFYGVLWWITLRELRAHSSQPESAWRYVVTSLYFWIGLLLTCMTIGAAFRYMMYTTPTI
ncbi:hypothetical protein N9Z08_02930 [Pirellulales bacterium]|nr:hypothetical protein [Pirellulales bacterium]MDB4365859.1 hypothetical protein [Pirellulales bacterium]